MNLKKDLAIVGGLFLVVVILLVFGKGYTSTSFLPNESTGSAIATNKPTSKNEEGKLDISVGTLRVSAEVADTKKERQKGLSHRDELPISEGMFFVFESASKYGIWMKDIKFPIDIIWIANNKKVVDIATNAVTEPGKNDGELTVYKPKAEALYILEINAGLTGANRIQIGDVVDFEL